MVTVRAKLSCTATISGEHTFPVKDPANQWLPEEFKRSVLLRYEHFSWPHGEWSLLKYNINMKVTHNSSTCWTYLMLII